MPSICADFVHGAVYTNIPLLLLYTDVGPTLLGTQSFSGGLTTAGLFATALLVNKGRISNYFFQK